MAMLQFPGPATRQDFRSSLPDQTIKPIARQPMAKNQRPTKPEKCSLDRKSRRRLWENLRKYCDDLFAMGYTLAHRFDPPQHAIDMFAELGLRHPRNVRSLLKFYNNFIPRCGHLSENSVIRVRDRKPQYQPKPPQQTQQTQQQDLQLAMAPPEQTSASAVCLLNEANGYVRDVRPQQQQQPMQQSIVQSIPTSIVVSEHDQIWRWLASNCFEVSTPSMLHGVHLNRSPMRRDGLNILSMDYSKHHPDPSAPLQRNKVMVVFGAPSAAQKYGSNSQRLCFANPLFCRDMVNKRMIFVPIPPCMVGRTLAETPQLSQAGINTLSINMQMQHPADMCKRRFVANDTLICLFDDANEAESALMLWRLLL